MAEIRKPRDSREEVLVRIVNQFVFVRNERPYLDPVGDGRTFTTNYDFVEGTLIVTLNGLRQDVDPESDYQIVGLKQFRFNEDSAFIPGDPEETVLVDYIKIMT